MRAKPAVEWRNSSYKIWPSATDASRARRILTAILALRAQQTFARLKVHFPA